MPPIDSSTPVRDDDTIVAPATPAGRSAVGVVRLSGPQSAAVARQLVRAAALPPRRACLAALVDAHGTQIDQVLVTLFPESASYTGEEVVELSCHGSPPVLAFAVERALELGARLAAPGEFTLRAFRNGRMDLVQAEAVKDLIDATTLYQAQVAARQTAGALSLRVRDLKGMLVELIALLEAGIDFAEDDVEIPGARALRERLDPIRAGIGRLAASAAAGKVVRDGLRLAVVGRPNVGKSSLFNRLLGRPRAIVNPAAGTTRDVVSEHASLDGIPVQLIDTAGIRTTADEIETEGVERSWQALADADCALVVVDASQEAAPADRELWERTQDLCPAILVGNKRDLGERYACGDPITLVSAKTGAGVEQLLAKIRRSAAPGLEGAREEAFVTNIRQERLLKQALAAADKAAAAIEADVPHEMVLLDLYEALHPLDAITGATTIDDILERIFSSFCIGK